MGGERASKKRPAEAVAEAPDEDEAFPRGGGDRLLTPLQKRQLTAQANEDFEAEQKSGKKQKKAKGSGGKDDAFFAGGDLATKQERFVELLKYKTLTVGMRLWGMVLECTPRGLVVSLPQGLRGHVEPDEASDALRQMLDPASKQGAALRKPLPGGRAPSLPDLFSIGQFVRCTVIGLGGGDAGDDGGGGKKARVRLSLRLRRLCEGSGPGALAAGRCVPAVVRSSEDHVYTLAFGVKGVSGVLPKKDVASYFGPDAVLLPGQLIDCVVTKPPAAADGAANGAAAVAAVTVSHDAVASAGVKDAAAGAGAGGGLTLAGLLPGMLVTAKVRSVLSDGLLVTFLTYFNGTIDHYHLADPIPSDDWAARYQEGQKLKARILYVDFASKRAGLSLLPHLLNCRMPTVVPMLGEIFDAATVRRVDPALGLLLQLPTSPSPAAAFAHVSNLADGRTERPEKVFKPGQAVRARVVGFRLVDGLALVSLKPSVLSQQVYSMKDLQPGQLLEGTVVASDPERGLVLQITPSIKALVPPLHASDLGTKKSKAKHREGQVVQGRVLSVDPDARRLTLTLKKALLGSKLAPLADARQAAPGLKAHGTVTGVKDGYGLFVTFYNGVTGVLKKSALGLLPGQKVSEAYEAGQVLRVQITRSDPEAGRIELALAGKKGAEAAAAAEAAAEAAAAAKAAKAGAGPPGAGLPGGLAPGEVVVSGVVNGFEEKEGGRSVVVLELQGKDGSPVTARLPRAHLSDHAAAAEKLAEQLRPGAALGPLVVLQKAPGGEKKGKKGGGGKRRGGAAVLVSRKPSLVAAAPSLPASLEALTVGAVLPGYVAHVTGDAVFVRFLDGLTGRAGLPQLADTFVTDPARHYAPGQSVRGVVTEVDAARGRFSLSLKPSAVGAGDGELLDCLFRDLELAARLQAEAEAGEEGGALDWGDIAPGALVTGRVAPDGIKPYGLTIDLDAAPDAVGVATPELGATGTFAPGQALAAVVADVARGDGIADLCILGEVVAAAGGAAAAAAGSGGEDGAPAVRKAPKRKLKVGSEVSAVVRTLKPAYAIVTLPAHGHAIAFLPRLDFNTQPPHAGAGAGAAGAAAPAPRAWPAGAEAAARVAAPPSAANGGRIVLSLSPAAAPAAPAAAGAGAAAGAKGAKGQGAREEREAVVAATVVAVGPLGLEVSYGKSGKGHIHLGEISDRAPSDAPPDADPLSAFEPGQTLTAAYLGHIKGLGGRRGKGVELSLRPSALAAAKKARPPGEKVRPAVDPSELSPGDAVVGWVQEVSQDALWLSLGPAARGRVHVFDAVDAPRHCKGFAARFKPGQALGATVVAAGGKDGKLDLSLRGGVAMRPHAAGQPPLPAPGQLLIGRIQSARGSGILVQLSSPVLGIVALTDVHDSWAPNALTGLAEGAFVRARVLDAPPDARGRLRLTLRPSEGGLVDGGAGGGAGGGGEEGGRGGKAPAVLGADDLAEGREVQGYVRHVSAKGLFVTLDRSRDARVKLSAMSDGFLEDPAAAFPEGSLVRGRVAAAAAGPEGRIEMSLRSGGGGGGGAGWRQLGDIEEGELTTGKVRRVERYGVFVDIARSNVTGLAHISQCGDGRIKDLAQRYQKGQVVRVRVVAVDREKKQVSLSMKPELVAEDSEDEEAAAGDAAAGKGGSAARRRDLDDLMVDAAEEEEGSEDEGSEEEAEGSEEGAAAGGGFDLDEMEIDSEGEGSEEGEESEEEEEEGGSGSGSEDESGSGSGSDDESGSGSEEEEGAGGGGAARGPGSLLAGLSAGAGPGSGWGELALDVDEGGEGDQGDADAPAKLSKAAKRRAKSEREAAIAAAEAARAAGGGAEPGSEADFERLLVGSPGSSYLWIRYMAFLISLGETDRARAVAQRALDAIPYREEGEKFNVWVAWLNLEGAYGAPDPAAALMALFNRALQYTDQKKLYLALLGILQRSGRGELLADALRAMTKKFSGSCKVWLRAIEHALTTGGDASGDAARKLLERALATLPRRKHVKAISHAALLEFRVGAPERGRSIMEGVLRNYPRRLDLWSMYIDQEVKQGDAGRVRSLLERATSMQLPPKKMKFLFRRWLEFEKAHGSEEQAAHVKQRALEYVQAHQD
ncbi:hypothetical protein Rsub_05174 [Raphidocelis subcapitata]|uniref:S1 motif domain-containing protein n=1 Tax=Raphidocelis subcapitata TaxID=307507 RepID=A0A2V0P3Y3_9CHLO|nr:hypothetical protein Rsub_05174 [Raphidocelis subcapitata]|eukprot:GBF92560.1 hypothetical protein Rsub_05174 [Raphidocelis subcapitata]